MTKKTKRSKNIKKTGILLFIVIVFGVIIAVAFYQNQNRQKWTVAEYFEILDPRLLDREYKQDGSILIVYWMTFKLKAKVADAHNVVVEGFAKAEPVDFETILKDQYQLVELASSRPFGEMITKNEGGKFPFEVQITSDETGDGTITIYL